MDLLLTGGTGFVGHAVLAALRAEGHCVRLLARRPEAREVRDLAAKHGAAVAPGDILNPGTLAQAAQGADGVVHLVGIISEAGKVTFENVHTRGTQNIVAAAVNAGAKRFVHMSALGTRAGAVSRYHQTKWVAEECVRRSGLKWTIFRPSLIYGPDDHFVNMFARMARFSPVLPVIGSAQTRFQPVYVGCVARAFALAPGTAQSVGQTYDLCGPDRLTLRQILAAILAATKRRRLIVRVPATLARLQAGLLKVLYARLLRRPPPLNRDQVIMLNEDTVGDPEPANKLFGLTQPRFGAEVRDYLRN